MMLINRVLCKCTCYCAFPVINRLWVVALTLMLSSGCDLEMKEDFEFQESDLSEIPLNDMTVYEWIESNQDTIFGHMLAAINRAGLQELYRSETKTYFLIPDTAFVDPNTGVFKEMTGNEQATVDSIEVERLQQLLKYHIIDEWVDQKSIPKFGVNYTYQTLIEGEEGIMTLYREGLLFRLVLNIDRSLPSTSKWSFVTQHNYRFNNGVAHVLRGYVRYKLF